jgi:hypothetical protein
MLIVNRRHLEHVLAEYVTHFNHHRPTVRCIKQHHSAHSHRPRHCPCCASNAATDSMG